MSTSSVWIIERTDITSESEVIVDELRSRGIHTELVNWLDLRPASSPPRLTRSGKDEVLPSVALVQSRVLTRNPDGDDALLYDWLELLERSGTRLINSSASIRMSRNKIIQAGVLRQHGVVVPESHAARSQEDIDEHLRRWGEIILKPVFGHASFDVLRLRAKEKATLPGKAYGVREEVYFWHLLRRHQILCVQPFVDNPSRDLRVIVVGGEIAACFYHVSTSPDGSVRHFLYPFDWAAVELNDELWEVSVKSVQALGLDMASLDIVEGSAGLTVIEVNPALANLGAVEKTPFDLTPNGITSAVADLVQSLLG